MQHFVVFAVEQRQFEAVFGGIDGEHARAAFAVQAVDRVALDARDVDGHVQSADDAVVTAHRAEHVPERETSTIIETESTYLTNAQAARLSFLP